jgi:hypothetical protein
MEHLFSPCTRLRDLAESLGRLAEFRNRYNIESLQELNLDISTAELLSSSRVFTYADLYAMLGNEDTVAWLTPHTAVAHPNGPGANDWFDIDESCRFSFRVDGKVSRAFARSREHLLEICDVVLRLLVASVVYSVTLNGWNHRDGVSINSTNLAYLMEQCQSLKFLTFVHIALDEDHCRVLGTYSRPDLDIVLRYCKLTNAGSSALAEVLGRNQGPTKLDLCDMDNIILADGLRGNSRLKRFEQRISRSRDAISNQELLAIADALRENKGLIELELSNDIGISDETWDAVCDSLKTHPTLEVLYLWPNDATTAPAVITSRIQALLDMMKMNTSIQTIYLDSRYSQHELFRGSVFPYLQTNRFRLRVRAIQRTLPITYRAKVLSRSLLATRADTNSFWMLLSGNTEVAFASMTATTTPAATLPAPATATVNAAPVVATGSTSAASHIVAPAASQKRKACP